MRLLNDLHIALPLSVDALLSDAPSRVMAPNWSAQSYRLNRRKARLAQDLRPGMVRSITGNGSVPAALGELAAALRAAELTLAVPGRDEADAARRELQFPDERAGVGYSTRGGSSLRPLAL
jgi:hypothetical protein